MDTSLYVMMAENFRLDGGACFGVVPKSIWSKNWEPDENNMLPVCNRCLLVKDGDRLILIDNGIGSKQSGKFVEHLHLFGDYSLQKSFTAQGFSFDQVTDVLLTHLHFDHCGGGVKYNAEGNGYELTFPNANYWCSKSQWEWAMKPNVREGASYLLENLLPMLESGKLQFVETPGRFSDHIEIMMANGHTDGQIVPLIKHKDVTIAFTADFIPSVYHVPLPYIASYDTRPLLSMKEKEEFLQKAVDNNYILCFEHDFNFEACTLTNTEKGIKPDKAGCLEEILND
jgi:glyoxylase-like metal-dependent hydrolase (beta-lactamase superfamily II)